MIVVIQGLRITTSCKYLKLTQSKYLDIIEDSDTSCLHIYFPKNFNSNRIIDKRIEVLNPGILKETDYIKLTNTRFSLNGIQFIKTVQHDYVINQFIVGKEVEFIMRYDEFHCEIVIPKLQYYRVDKYMELLKCNPYIKVISSDNFTKFGNFYSINISKTDINLVSNNEFEFNTKKTYTAYLLTAIDVLQSFKNILEKILTGYGFEYVRYPIDKKANTVNRVIWRVTQMDKQLTRKVPDGPVRYAVLKTIHIEFKISTPNLAALSDFRTKYNNLDLLTNLTTFQTEDKLGIPWISNIWWGPMGDIFNQDYAVDEQSNIAQESEFSCDIQHYVVYDEMYYRINNVILELQDKNKDKLDIIRI